MTLALPLLAFAVISTRIRAGDGDAFVQRREHGRWIARLTIVTTAATYLCALWLGWLAYGYGSRPVEPGLAGTLSGILSAVDMAVMLWAALGVYLLLPGVIGLLMAIQPARRWLRPARILVLRRFGRDDASRALKTLLREEIAPFGHVYTLADRDIRIAWYVRLPVVFAQLVFFHFRSRRIRSPAMLDRLLTQAELRWARNINWFVSWDKTFAVHSSDAMWRDCVLALGARADLVLIDVTAPSDNLAWEIDACAEQRLWDRVVLLTDAAHEARSRAFLARWPAAVETQRLIVHDRESARLRPLLSAMLDSGRGRADAATRPVSRWWYVRTALTMIGPIGFAALVLSGIMAHDVAVDYFSDDEVASRQLARLHDPATRDRAFDRLIEMARENREHQIWHWDAERTLESLWHSAPDSRERILDLTALVGGMRSEALWLRALRELPADALELRRRVIADWRGSKIQADLGSGFVDARLLELVSERLAGGPTRRPRTDAELAIDRLLIDAVEQDWPGNSLEQVAGCDPSPVLRDAAHAKVEQLKGTRHFIAAKFFECQAQALSEPSTTEAALERLLTVLGQERLNGRRFAINRAFAEPVSEALSALWDTQPALRPRLQTLAGLIGGRISRELDPGGDEAGPAGNVR